MLVARYADIILGLEEDGTEVDFYQEKENEYKFLISSQVRTEEDNYNDEDEDDEETKYVMSNI